MSTTTPISTFVDVLQRRVEDAPDTPMFTFLADGDDTEVRLTCRQLDRRSRAVALSLQAVGEPGDRVLIIVPPGLDYIVAVFACFYAGMVAVPAYPPRREGDEIVSRLQAIAEDARPACALTQSELLYLGPVLTRATLAAATMQWIAIDGIGEQQLGAWRERHLPDSTLAVIQYTSGSTTAPKGVVLTHAHFLRTVEAIRRRFRLESNHGCVVSWAPAYHDLGLIGGVLGPLLIGMQSVLLSPAAFVQRPQRWLQAISKYGGVLSGGPNFGYELCLERVTDREIGELDLRTWAVAINGTEPIRHATIERFSRRFAAAGFNRRAFTACYGLTEATVLVSSGQRDAGMRIDSFDADALEHGTLTAADSLPVPPARSRTLVSCGSVLPELAVEIVEPDSRLPLPDGTIGEIWVRGSTVADGYWEKDEESACVFGARLAGDDTAEYLRTGDLGAVIDQELFVTGRLKDLMIVRGKNFYAHDFELTIESCHGALLGGGCVAFSIEQSSQEVVVIVQEVDTRRAVDVNLEQVRAAIRQTIAREYEVSLHDVVLVVPGTIRRTASGKKQRNPCREAYLRDYLGPAALQTTTCDDERDQDQHQVGTGLGHAKSGTAQAETIGPAPDDDMTAIRFEWTPSARAGAEEHCSVPSTGGTDSVQARERVCTIAAEILDVAAVDPDAHLIDLGLDSVGLMRLAHRMEECSGIRPPAASVYRAKTLSELSSLFVHSSSLATQEQEETGTGTSDAEREIGAPVNLSIVAPSEHSPQSRNTRQALGGTISLSALAELLAQLSDLPLVQRRLYPSAGGLYAVQTYLHFAAGAVENLRPGTYLYRPANQHLLAVHTQSDLPFGRWLGNENAVMAIFFVVRLPTVESAHGSDAQALALIETGAMAQLLATVALEKGIELQPVRLRKAAAVRSLFALDESYDVLLTLVGAPLADASEATQSAGASKVAPDQQPEFLQLVL